MKSVKADNDGNQTTTKGSEAGQGSSHKNVDLSAYVLQEYKDLLFPKQKTKYERDHERAMALKQMEEDEDE